MVCVDIWYGIDDIPAEMGPTSVTIGVFDGLHRAISSSSPPAWSMHALMVSALSW